MITLASGQNVQIQASVANAAYYTLFGCEVPNGGGAPAYKVLAFGEITVASSYVTVYTAPAATQAFISHLKVSNNSASPFNFYVTGTANIAYGFVCPASGEASFDADGWHIFSASALGPTPV